ncbi:hypothetical protein Taro_014845 [Colocasia esculenta]|uniref:Transmembrane protein n=1 Tax=Colocasia esculenta TaxID=4460 RepID=A0A843UKE2_COLES|nr:hypothetical protein [Colocasia esculenta]
MASQPEPNCSAPPSQWRSPSALSLLPPRLPILLSALWTMPPLPAPLGGYAHFAAHAALAASAALLSSLLSLPSRLLEGLHTYIHPDTLPGGGDGFRAAIRRPSDPGDQPQPQSQSQLRRRPRSGKDGYGGGRASKSVFDESGAQLLRLRLVDSHLRSRLYFSGYRGVFTATLVALSSLLLGTFFPAEDSSAAAAAAVPVLTSLFAACYVFFSLAKIAFERSATKRSERQVAAFCGILGFFFALLARSVLSPSLFDFVSDGGSLGLWSIAASAVAGCLSGFLFVPATRAARCFWLGTDQLRWNLEVISCGVVTRVLLYIVFVTSFATPLLWIKPIVEFPARNFSPGKLQELRVWLLAASAAFQLAVLRPNVQTYMNEAVLCWYQRLHASKVPDLDFGRAKVFLHNHYMCLVVLQFFAAPALELLFLGLSQIRENLFGGVLFFGKLTDASSVAKETALFLAWQFWAANESFFLLKTLCQLMKFGTTDDFDKVFLERRACMGLRFLDLVYISLSGEFPYLFPLQNLAMLNLSDNNFIRSFP